MNDGQTRPIFLDNHSTTMVDPRVVEAMLPYFTQMYGNAGSINHLYGDEAREAVEESRASIANAIGADSKEIVFTSGATESNNLALRGITDSPRIKGKHLLSATTEHRAILDPITKLSRRGFELTLLDVNQSDSASPGLISLESFANAVRSDTCLASVMLANNEIGAIQPLAQFAEVCREQQTIFHSDATQAVGKIPVDVDQLGLDLMSFTAHKIHGPKGVGALFVRKRERRIRLAAQIDGGGQEQGIRSGTLNVPGIVGFAKAIELALENQAEVQAQIAELRDRLFGGLCERIPGVVLNGPPLERRAERLAQNLNCSFADVDGEALIIHLRGLAVSSGSACTSTDPNPSHVLRAMGIDDDQVRASLRFGLSRFTTREEIDQTIDLVASAVDKLRGMRS